VRVGDDEVDAVVNRCPEDMAIFLVHNRFVVEYFADGLIVSIGGHPHILESSLDLVLAEVRSIRNNVSLSRVNAVDLSGAERSRESPSHARVTVGRGQKSA